MRWQERYRHKLCSPEEAVTHIANGSSVRLPMGPVPLTLLRALAERHPAPERIRVFQGASRQPLPFLDAPERWQGKIEFITDFVSQLIRPAIEQRWADFLVTDYSVGSRSQYFDRNDIWHPDVFLAVVSEPDANGRVSFGYTLWHSRPLLQNARLKIAEVAPNVLRTFGDNAVPLESFDFIVEARAQVPPPPPPELSPERAEVTAVIGAYVSTLVRDGDTIQIGTGTLSSCIGDYLTGKNDLGIDAEILVASAVELVKLGVATGKYKTFHPGVATASFIVPGSDFAFCHLNPRIALYDIEWCNALPRIAQIENLVAINQASMIDLTGQAASESIGATMYTGPGGQLVWSMGALYAPNGRSILVLPSTARNGTISRIVSRLPSGSVVTVPRTFVDYVITEHGIVNLQGRTQRERARALMEIAHPQFRDELRDYAERTFWPRRRVFGP
ncbi:MAG: 4-hydroxybutyrate CoA-transferase [Candidatus Binatia bacterium]|nr:MAG: 4-hydroxybutyrate CoA-transferase [Candidatus Binatia bacterium]